MVMLSAFVVGGGYVILSVADERFSRKKWIRRGELFEMLPLFQMIPGIIGGHTAIYLGNRVAGLAGAAVALCGMALPSILVFLAISVGYRSIPLGNPHLEAVFLGLRSALTGLLAEIAVRMWRKSLSGACGYLFLSLALAALVFCRVAPGLVIVAGIVAGLAVAAVRDRMAKAAEGGAREFRSSAALFVLFLTYGLMAFGGGFVLVPAYMRDFVGAAAPYLQLPASDFANVMALTEMTPGPVAVNCATFFGHALGGVPWAFLATLAVLLPGSVLLMLALRGLERFRSSAVVRGIFFGVRPVTLALVVTATWSFAGMSVWRFADGSLSFSPLGAVIAALSFALVFFRRLGGVATILLSAAIAVVCRLAARIILV